MYVCPYFAKMGKISLSEKWKEISLKSVLESSAWGVTSWSFFTVTLYHCRDAEVWKGAGACQHCLTSAERVAWRAFILLCYPLATRSMTTSWKQSKPLVPGERDSLLQGSMWTYILQELRTRGACLFSEWDYKYNARRWCRDWKTHRKT